MVIYSELKTFKNCAFLGPVNFLAHSLRPVRKLSGKQIFARIQICTRGFYLCIFFFIRKRKHFYLDESDILLTANIL